MISNEGVERRTVIKKAVMIGIEGEERSQRREGRRGGLKHRKGRMIEGQKGEERRKESKLEPSPAQVGDVGTLIILGRG